MQNREVVFEYCSPKFKCLFESNKRFFVFHGGRGGGKDHSLARFVLEMMSEFTCCVLICREFQNSIKDSNHKILKDIIMSHDLTDVFEITDYEIRCPSTGSNVIFSGLHHNIDSLKSIEGVDICLVNEAQTISEESLDYLIPTIRNNGSIVIFSLNPRFRSDVIYKNYIDADRSDTECVEIGLLDNRFAPKPLLDEYYQLQTTDPEKWSWMYGGQCMGAEEMALIKPIVILEARKRIPVRDESLKIVAGFDVAGEGADQAVIVRRRGAEILSVHTFDKGDTNAHLDWAKNIYIESPWDLLIVDATGSPGICDMMSVWGNANRSFETVKWVASRAPRNKLKYINARTESWGIMRDWLRDQGQLTQHKEWDEMSRITYKFSGKEQIALDPKSKLSKSPDFGDALALSLWRKDEPKEEGQSNTYSQNRGFIG